MAQQPHFGLFTLGANRRYRPASVDVIVSVARECLDSMFVRDVLFDSPQLVKNFLTVRMARLEQEVFTVIFLDAQHRVIECRDMFFGSLSQTSVHPREIIKAALLLNAGAVILAHNHPSGVPEPSRADEALTQALKTTLALVDIRVLDHFVVGGGQVISFAERGLL